jgi:NDP-sugar pyrophosphorylase family protein
MQTVILAGGLAARLGPPAKDRPKSMIEVAGKPFLEHQLELLKQNNIRRVVLCIGHLGSQIREYFGDGSSWGVTITYSEDGEALLGTGGALKKAELLLEKEFFILYGDSYLLFDYQEIDREYSRRHRSEALMVVYRNENLYDCSNVIYKDGLILRYDCDRRQNSPGMVYIDAGLSILRRSILRRIPSGVPSSLAQLFATLSSEGRLQGLETTQRFYHIGTPESLADLRYFLSKKSIC